MEIKGLKQWLIWKMKDGRKVPLNKWGQSSGVDRPADFMTYDEAKDIYEKRNVDGVAFVFTETDGFFGIDLDNSVSKVTRKTKTFKPWAEEILNAALSYSEISPSLKGLKIFCKGKLPDACRHRFDIGDGQMEIYESGRFFTFTEMFIPEFGKEIKEFDPAQLIQKHTPETPKPRFPETFIQIGSGSDLRQRGEAYIQNAERPLEGARNSTAFNLAGHLFSLTGDNGERLSEGDVFQLMEIWNLGLAEPLNETELGRCVKNARDKGTPRETKPAGIIKTTQTDDFDFNVLWKEDVKEEEEPPKAEIPKLPDFEIPGLVGAIRNFIRDSALYPQSELALGAALCTVAALIGRKTVTEGGVRGNCYIAAIAPSGSGKNYPREIINKILHQCGADELHGPASIGSNAGLLNQLAKKAPCSLFPLDEIGHLFSAINKKNQGSNHLALINKVLLELYSSAGSPKYVATCYADAERNPVIEYPHCIIYGSSTKETFFDGMTKQNLTDGLLARFWVVSGDYQKSRKGLKRQEIPKGIIEHCQRWAQFQAENDLAMVEEKEIKLSPEAQERIDDQREQIEDKRIGEQAADAAIWSRVSERAVKFALIIACGRHNPTEAFEIDINDINAGIALANYGARFIIHKAEAIGKTQWERDLEEIREYIADAKSGRSKTQILRKFRRFRKKDLNEALNSLIEQKLVDMVEKPSSTKPGLVFVSTG